jgi:gas vesicle protein
MSNIGGVWGKRAGLLFQTKDPEASRKHAHEAAKQWSMNALELSEKVSPLVRNEGCDAACMLAMFNLGEIAEQCGSPKEAERWYRDALALTKKIGDQEEATQELMKELNEGLERVSKK